MWPEKGNTGMGTSVISFFTKKRKIVPFLSEDYDKNDENGKWREHLKIKKDRV